MNAAVKTLNGAALVAALLLTSCGTDTHRIDPSGTEGLTTVRDIDPKDWQMAAESCIDSLLKSGALDRKDGRKSIAMVSDVRNETSSHIDTEILTNMIREALLKSGKAVTTTAVGGAKGPEDSATRQVRSLQNDALFDQRTVQPQGTAIAPDVSVGGEIIELYAEKGRAREANFYFHITLTDLKTGLAVWEGQSQVAKQSERGLFGF
jgi:uncharacterized protein (TIGR02722 family)